MTKKELILAKKIIKIVYEEIDSYLFKSGMSDDFENRYGSESLSAADTSLYRALLYLDDAIAYRKED